MASLSYPWRSKHGSGILNNEMYIGRYIWNRRKSRKKPKSGDREYLMRPTSEWIVAAHPETHRLGSHVGEGKGTSA